MAQSPDTRKKRLSTDEIASIARDINRVMFGGILQNLDDTLVTRGRSKGLKIYDELARDTHAYAVLQKRKLAVTSRPWQVYAASESPRDTQAAELVTAQFKALGFDRLTRNLLDAQLKGFAVGEVMWDVRGAELVCARVKPRNARRFVFAEDETLRLITREHLMDGEALPGRKFIVHRFGDDESPYGLGLGNKLFWPVFFKRQDITFWLTFADKFGSPTAVGKYPAGAIKEEQKKLLDALAAIAQDAGIIVPDGMMIELLEVARTGSIDTYEKLARYMDEQMSECVLGESITTTPALTGLGSGVATVQNEVRKEIAQADADEVSETLNETLVRWIVDYNLPGAGYPTVWRNFEEQADLGAQATRDQSICEMGFRPSLEYINATYGDNWTEAPVGAGLPAIIGDQSGASPLKQPAFAEPAIAVAGATEDQVAIDQAAAEFSAEWEKLLGPRIDELVAMAESTGDLVTFRERLAELMKAAPSAALVESLERAGFTAHLLGRTSGN